MKSPLFAVVALALLLSGCSTIDSRIKEKSATYSQLSPTDQQIIRYGYISVGFTRDMVYMALDKPEKVISGPGPNQETWVYHNFYNSDGSSLTPGQRIRTNAGTSTGGRGAASGMTSRSGQNNTYTVEYDPTLETIKEDAKVKVHVIFNGDKVADIKVINGM
ncbi:hypothetical protein K0B96_01405 [Horticoccus luteus]|uniref:Beta-barrel assembly machine subunit BamE n=1 Tax=Horticoccus luteus TaxID=2862869 RepID=A0A8F9TVY9_9BACT|nr:hypothetical protein [Horticoccus luteus]QYM79303.1 hypothetical protein K0B96_01405 [Horticoccus luteus]